MSDSLEVQVLRNALATEQKKSAVFEARIAELEAARSRLLVASVQLQCALTVRDVQLRDTTIAARTEIQRLKQKLEQAQNDLAARN